MYYTVPINNNGFRSDLYQFPILTSEDRKFKLIEIVDGEDVVLYEFTANQPSKDLGTTSFNDEMKGSELNRWIGKAIDNGEFIKIG